LCAARSVSCAPARPLLGSAQRFDSSLGYPGEGWRILTANVTALGTRHDDIRSQLFDRADICLLQETKHDAHSAPAIDRAWAVHGQRVVWGQTPPRGKGRSCGVAIAARAGWAHQVKVDGTLISGTRRWQAAVAPKSVTGLPAPLLLVTVYGVVNSKKEAAAAAETADVIAELMGVLAGWHGPWLIAGDVNMEPSTAPGLSAMVAHGSAVEVGAMDQGGGPTFIQGTTRSRLSSVWMCRSLMPWWRATDIVSVGVANHLAVRVEFTQSKVAEPTGWQLPAGRPTAEVPLPDEPGEEFDPDQWRRDRAEDRWEEWAERYWPPLSDDPATMWREWCYGVRYTLDGAGPPARP